ncbi:MAG: molybdopterin molybdotransferase MoeA, partial [Gemmatimonadota bacterium]|nr:molybdopterin molybdotransferase MoeA [Gemmatimonadota bacterium]
MKADWVTPRDALRTILESVSVLGTETISIAEARGRILGEDLIAPIDLPRWTNSGMDGFAVHSADMKGASPYTPIPLKVIADIPAGLFPDQPLPRGCAARIMTGAPVPSGADSVVRVEDTNGGTGIGGPDAEVIILNARDAGKNIRRQGDEIAQGTTGLRAGTRMNPGALGIAASLGGARLVVHRRPIVALLTSGDELVHLDRYDEVLAGRRTISSSSYSIKAALEEAGCDVRYLGIADDSPESLRQTIRQARGCDALVTVGGISVGNHDYVKGVLLELDTRFSFWRVRMRPGSPFAFGVVGSLDGIPWFGLPGNPASSAVTFETFCRPALLRMGGTAAIHRRWISARLLDQVEAVPGLTQFIRVHLDQEEDGTFVARLTGKQASGYLSSIALANGLMIVEPAEVA